MNDDAIKLIAYMTLIVVILGANISWAVFQWFECRDAGMGILYCLKHIS